MLGGNMANQLAAPRNDTFYYFLEIFTQQLVFLVA